VPSNGGARSCIEAMKREDYSLYAVIMIVIIALTSVVAILMDAALINK
tara:strand:+ start:228 stop:371 length:144 start_codon:yes stop_codon:yes gene_type:complete